MTEGDFNPDPFSVLQDESGIDPSTLLDTTTSDESENEFLFEPPSQRRRIDDTSIQVKIFEIQFTPLQKIVRDLRLKYKKNPQGLAIGAQRRKTNGWKQMIENFGITKDIITFFCENETFKEDGEVFNEEIDENMAIKTKKYPVQYRTIFVIFRNSNRYEDELTTEERFFLDNLNNIMIAKWDGLITIEQMKLANIVPIFTEADPPFEDIYDADIHIFSGIFPEQYLKIPILTEREERTKKTQKNMFKLKKNTDSDALINQVDSVLSSFIRKGSSDLDPFTKSQYDSLIEAIDAYKKGVFDGNRISQPVLDKFVNLIQNYLNANHVTNIVCMSPGADYVSLEQIKECDYVVLFLCMTYDVLVYLGYEPPSSSPEAGHTICVVYCKKPKKLYIYDNSGYITKARDINAILDPELNKTLFNYTKPYIQSIRNFFYNFLQPTKFLETKKDIVVKDYLLQDFVQYHRFCSLIAAYDILYFALNRTECFYPDGSGIKRSPAFIPFNDVYRFTLYIHACIINGSLLLDFPEFIQLITGSGKIQKKDKKIFLEKTE